MVVRRGQIWRIGWAIKTMEDNGSPGRPVSSGLQVPGESGHCRARTRPAWWCQGGCRLYPKKNRGENFSSGFLHLEILGRGEPLCRHSIHCCFVSGSQWYNQVSYMVTNRDRKSFGSHRKNSKSCSDDWHRWRFWSAFRHFGTHFVESFRMSKSSWMMDPTRSREMSGCSAIDIAEIRRSSKISSWIWSIIPVRLSFESF